MKWRGDSIQLGREKRLSNGILLGCKNGINEGIIRK